MSMNIVEAYIKFKGQLVILVSGMSGSGKSNIAKEISRDFKIENINTNKFCKKDYTNKVTIQVPTKVNESSITEAETPKPNVAVNNNNIEIINWDTDDVYDWDMLNKEIEKYSKSGVVVSGVTFPKDKINVKADFHIHIKLNKQNLFKRRIEYLDEHNEDCQQSGRNLNKDIELLIFNKYSFPYYLEYTSRNIITKYINGNELMGDTEKDKLYHDKLYDESFDYLMSQIQRYLDNQNKPHEQSRGIREQKRLENFNDNNNNNNNADDFDAEDISSEETPELETTSDDLSESSYLATMNNINIQKK